MPIAPECQPIADAITALTAQEQDKRAEIAGLDDVAKWTAMLELGTIRRQLADQQVQLQECQKQHADDLAIEIAVFDVPGVSGLNRVARAWQLTGAGQAVKQTVTVRGGVATFTALPLNARQSLGLTIEETDHPDVSGPDFRSGPLPPLAAHAQLDPVSRIEIVILDGLTLTEDDLRQAAPPLPIQLPFASGGIFGTINISITGLGFLLANGTLTISAVGTAAGVVISSPLNFTAVAHVAPSFSMPPSSILDLASGIASSLSAPGIAGNIIASLTDFLTPRLISATVPPLSTLLNRAIVDRVCTALGLKALPSGSVLSVRQVQIEGGTMTLTPALAAFGRVLSNFQPAAPDALPQLSDLRIEPTAISSSDPIRRVALGSVTLTGPAPAGGLTIVLSSDRPEVGRVDPSSLVVAEGASTGEFSVTGLSQSVMQLSNVDVTITAALADQKLTAAVTVKNETPLTSVAGDAGAFSTPQTAQLELDIMQAINQYRLSRGLQALATDPAYSTVARGHSVDMAAGRTPLGHDGLQVRLQAVVAAGAKHPAAIEQVAAGQFSAADIVAAWLQEKLPLDGPPVAPLEYPLTSVAGAGVARSQSGTLFYTILLA